MKCSECRYCVNTDYGYSNYTVEGTSCDCLFNLNPGFPKDRFWGEEPVLDYAEQCPKYSQGSGLYFNVEDDWSEPDQIDYIESMGLASEFINWRNS